METEVSVCVGCLSPARELRALAETPHEHYFKQVFSDINRAPLDERFLRLCWLCAAILNKAAQFRRQVEDSCRTLSRFLHQESDWLEENTKDIARPSTLTTRHLERVSYPESTGTDVKIEANSDNEGDVKYEDCDSDVPLKTFTECLKVKQEGKRVRKRKEKVKKKVTVGEEADEGKTKSGKLRLRKSLTVDPAKIRTILLTPEELTREREADRSSEAYLKLPYRCNECIQGFDHEVTLNDHMDRKHNLTLGKYQCGTCKSVLSSQASFSTHCRRHLLRFECAACGKRTIDKGAMIKHYGSEHEETSTRYTCNICGHVSPSHRAHRYHREKHKEKPQCEDCGRTFINKSSLRSHILNQHRVSTEAPRYACGDCGKTYRGKSGLLMHSWTHSAQPAYCVTCSTHFSTPHNYRHHLRTSRKHRTDADLKFACTACEKRFTSQRKLDEHHAWAHLKSTAHQCPLCDKMFKQRVGLERHRKYVHEKIRPPRNKICHYCGRGFTTGAILQSHLRTHTGARPLPCAACPATFAHAAALYTHARLLHRA